MLNLSGKVVLVTGGSQGLGSVICKQLAVSGAKVILHYNQNEKSAKHLRKEINENIEIIKANRCPLRQRSSSKQKKELEEKGFYLHSF